MSARSVNSILTATYWEIGRRIVEFEQGGKARAEYGEDAADASGRRPDGQARARVLRPAVFSRMRTFYVGWEICPTASAKFEAHVRLPCQKKGLRRIGDLLNSCRANPDLPENLDCREADGPKLPTVSANLSHENSAALRIGRYRRSRSTYACRTDGCISASPGPTTSG